MHEFVTQVLETCLTCSYTLSPRDYGPQALDVHIRQTTHACVIIINVAMVATVTGPWHFCASSMLECILRAGAFLSMTCIITCCCLIGQ